MKTHRLINDPSEVKLEEMGRCFIDNEE